MEIAQSLKSVQPSYIREILSAATSPDVISLAGGLPDKTTFPLAIMKPILENLANNESIFQYGNTAGYSPLLEYVKEYYLLPEHHASIITTGSQQGLDLIARAYINPGDKIVMEAPSYLGAMQVFDLAQAEIITVRQSRTGPDLDALETCFAIETPKVFYTVPDFHNPTGVSWHLDTRKKVAQLCIRYNVTLIEDAPYRELRFTDEELPMVSSFCPNNSITLRSFSKIAAPGLRIGVVSGDESLIRPMIKVKQAADLHSSTPMQALLMELLTHSDFHTHLSKVRQSYAKKYEKMEQALTKYLPSTCTFEPVKGGMFVWITLPECDPYEIANLTLKNNVAVVPGDVFYPQNSCATPALRLNYTNASHEQILTAIQRLAEVIKLITS